jgi:phosphatidylserine/phosphatidylglycerophosphate/cardiolipin synthase-like enzyme
MIFPFNFDERFQTVFSEDKEFLRFLLFEETTVAQTVRSNDTDLKVTACAILKSAVEEWVKEMTAKTTTGASVLYVHNKLFIIDALSDRPIVLTGSANFSHPSIVSNDENSLLVIGESRVADIYLSEFNRLFEHFWPRYLRFLHPENHLGFDKPLDETHTWHKEYFEEGKFGMKRRLLFTTMKGAIEI